MMVLLTVTPPARAAIEELCRSARLSSQNANAEFEQTTSRLEKLKIGSPIDHNDLIEISKSLVANARNHAEVKVPKEWRLDTLLKGAKVYQTPPPPKPEPTAEYKALMKRLREEEEQRQYERLLNPPPAFETFGQKLSNSMGVFDPATAIGASAETEVDEVTYAEVNRQMALIINVLVSIIACSVAIWIAARRWSVPQRLALSLFGSGIVAIAEVAIYMGYIRRIKEAKSKEAKKVETKEIVDSWVFNKGTRDGKLGDHDSLRYRKGKHR